MEYGRGKAHFKATILSAILSGTGMMLMAPAVEAATLQTKSYVYDALGRVIQEKDSANTVQVTHTYDANGNRKTSTDALGRITTNDYDELNRLTKTTVTANNVVQSETEYGYDARDNLISVKDPRNLTTTYTYDGFDQLKSQISPDTGTTNYVPNSAGQVTTRTNAANQATQYQYDALGRVTQASYADGRVVTYTYDQGTHGKGRLTTLSDSDSSLSWTYNADGQALTRTQTIGTGQTAVTTTLSYGYNSAGQLTSLTLPSGAVIGYAYDTQGRVESLTRNGTTILSGITYRPFGGITGWTWANGQVHYRTYDSDGRLDLLSIANTEKNYEYDAVSRIDDILEVANNQDYSYDTLDRLSAYNGTRTWTYDAVGNRTQQTIGAATETYTYASTSNRLQSLTNSGNSQLNRSYQYTTTGHTSSDGVNTFTYDARERLVSASNSGASATYTINPLGQRVKKSVVQGGVTTVTTFVYDDAGHLVAESEPSGTGSEYVYLGDIPVAVNRTTVQSSQGSPIQLAAMTSATFNNKWSSASFANAVGGSSNFITTIQGAPEGIVVDNNNTYNVAPNTVSMTGVNAWGSMEGSVTPAYGGAYHRRGDTGTPQGTLVDNPQATVEGPWTSLTCTGECWGTNYLKAYNNTGQLSKVTWTTDITTAGTYNIYVMPTATNVYYKVSYGGNTYTVYINGVSANGQKKWVLLASYSLPVGQLSVSLDNQSNPTMSSINADAVLVSDPNAPKGFFSYFNWHANLPTAGTYEVYTRLRHNDPYAGSLAKYTVNHAGGAAEVTVNQPVAGANGEWALLGTYTFNAGLNTVSVSDEQALTSKNTIADAVVFAQPGAPLGNFIDAIWTPTLPATGLYEVQAWWPTPTTNTGSSVVWYTVHTAQGPVKVVKDQTQQAGQWVSLGQFNLDSATAKVTLADYGVQGKRVYADGVRFIPINTTTTNTLYNVHADHLNTPRQLTTSDANNTLVWKWDSEPFGSTPANADPDQNGQQVAFNLRFPGQYFDAETGKHYNYFRDYDPGIGRYIESDPIGLNGGPNTYAYVSSNPITKSDPSGLVEWSGTMGGGMAALPFGAGFFRFSLRSECVNGKRGSVTVWATGIAGGFGAMLTGGGGGVKFEDGLSDVNPEVFNGSFYMSSAGAAWGAGYGGAAIMLGGANSLGHGVVVGVDLSIAGIMGSSTVMARKVEDCCSR